jgi:hypothetical protein
MYEELRAIVATLRPHFITYYLMLLTIHFRG